MTPKTSGRNSRRGSSAWGTEAEKRTSEAINLAVRLWEELGALPFVPDAFRMPPVRRQFYAHGAFMGAAPALLADERWRRILSFLMPDVYADVSEALREEGERGAATIIPMFENNPVMAAFGISRHAAARTEDTAQWGLEHVGVEWDLFVDGELAKAFVDGAPSRRDHLLDQLLRTAVVAHAGALDTLQENLGFCQHADVRDTEKVGPGRRGDRPLARPVRPGLPAGPGGRPSGGAPGDGRRSPHRGGRRLRAAHLRRPDAGPRCDPHLP